VTTSGSHSGLDSFQLFLDSSAEGTAESWRLEACFSSINQMRLALLTYDWNTSISIRPQREHLTSSFLKINYLSISTGATKKINSVASVRELTLPTERPPLVGEVSANFFGQKVPRGQHDWSLQPYSRLSRPLVAWKLKWILILQRPANKYTSQNGYA
jgi:hypothetical protein